MLREMLEYVLTPCPRELRRMGYLSELIGIKLRYRRCRHAWLPHLERTKDLIREGMSLCQQRRKAVILGSGQLYDIPLADLSRSFREVVLVDLVQPLKARWERRPFPNVKLLADDVSNTLESVLSVRRPTQTLPPRGTPNLFLDDPEVDFVASINLTSQLPFIPVTYLEKHELAEYDATHALAQGMIQDHLDYLKKFNAVVSLVTDFQKIKLNGGTVVETSNVLYDMTIPWTGDEWNWELAPRPELHRIYSFRRRVIGIPNIHTAALSPQLPMQR